MPGGLIAGLLFVLPGAAVILGLGFGYAIWGGVALVQAAFPGVTATVEAIVVHTLLRIARKALVTPGHWVVAGLAFVAMFALGVPFPAVIAAATLWGYWQSRHRSPAPAPVVPGCGPSTRCARRSYGARSGRRRC